MRQCTCGRSKIYPYCDNTHKEKTIKTVDLNKEKDNDSSIPE
jgi:CDGSH-type Zn-finger protein